MAEDEDIKVEIRALVVGFLQQSLKEKSGFTLEEFDRQFPTACDEEHDWYTKFGKKNSLDVLKLIPDTAKISMRNGSHFISLNLNSEAADKHLIDLITKQKSSGKRKSKPASRAQSSFSLNRRFDNPYRQNYNQNRPRYNSSYNYSVDPWKSYDLFRNTPTIPSHTRRTSTGYSSQAIPKRFPPTPTSNISSKPVIENIEKKATQPLQPSKNQQSTQFRPTQIPLDKKIVPVQQPIPTSPVAKENITPEDDSLTIRKHHLRQRLQLLLSKTTSEVKLIFLCSLYQREFDEKLDPSKYGHSGIVGIIDDPVISPYLCVDYSQSPNIYVKLKAKDDKDGDKLSQRESIKPFNLVDMRNCLDNITLLREPKKKLLPIEDLVRFKTYRIILKSPNSKMRLDEWVSKFEQETKLHLNIKDYGHDSYESFFNEIAKDSPLTITKDESGLYGEIDHPALTDWIKKQVSLNCYRSIISLSKDFDRIAFPDDEYNYSKAAPEKEFVPASILTVTKVCELWLIMRNQDAYKELVAIESTMNCYNDFKNQDITVRLPKVFMIPGCPCAAYDETTKKWYRAVVIKRVLNTDDVLLLLVDYGMEKYFSRTSLWCLFRKHIDVPVVPYCCSLKGIDMFSEIPSYFKMILQEYSSANVVLACKFSKQENLSQSLPYMPKTRWVVDLCDTRNNEQKYLIENLKNFNSQNQNKSES